jgi:glutaredoxin
VLADDLDYASAQQMPQIGTLLRDEGVSFENTFVSYPICCPSRATMLTGEYAHNHNVRGNKRPVGGFEKFGKEGNEEDSIAARLQANGYRTALIGKYLKKYFKESLVPFGEVNLERSASTARTIQRQTGQTGVPVIKIGSKGIVGFDKEQIEKELGLS